MISLEEVEEYFPDDKHEILLMSDMIVLDYLRRCVPANLLFDAKELYRMLRNGGINNELTRRGFQRLTIFGGSGSGGIKLIFALNRLWVNGHIRKFAKGIFIRSGRQYGVHWLINERTD